MSGGRRGAACVRGVTAPRARTRVGSRMGGADPLMLTRTPSD
jgi:hypothetical protein